MSDEDRKYYVYGWFCEDWGKIPFYVGKGCGNRYKSKNNRSMQFTALTNRFKCFPMIIVKNLTEEKALLVEREVKKRFMLEGMPIIDIEVSEKHKMMQEEGYRREKGNGKKFGRPKIEVDVTQLPGETVSDTCKRLGISRATYYRKIS